MPENSNRSRRPVALADADMTTTRPVARRGFLRVVGTGAVGATAVIAGIRPAVAFSDPDSVDPSGRGRGTGYNNTDPVDPLGRGRPPGGQGRGRPTGYNDPDSYDPAGYGRRGSSGPTLEHGPSSPQYPICSDTDQSDRDPRDRPADPGGMGRRC